MFSSHTQTKGNCEVIKVLTNIMVISPYYIYKKSLIYIIHLKVTQYFCQLSLNKAGGGWVPKQGLHFLSTFESDSAFAQQTLIWHFHIMGLS